MAISPTISVCFIENNTLLQITDTTGAYSLGNTGGYGTPNDASTDITSAIITIGSLSTSGKTTILDTVDVTSQINEGIVVGDYVFTNITPSSTADGMYSFIYTVISPAGTVSTTINKLFIGKVRCCVDKLWKVVPTKMCSECETDAYLDRVLTAEGYYRSLLAMGGCHQLDSITKVLTQLQAICSFEDCNC